MRRLLAALALLTVASCGLVEGFKEDLSNSPAWKEAILTCGAITGIGNVLAEVKDRMTEGQISAFDKIIDQAEPLCTAPEPPANQLDALKALLGQARDINIAVAKGG